MIGVLRTIEDFTTWGGGVDVGYIDYPKKECEHCKGYGYLLQVGDDDFFSQDTHREGDKVTLDGEEFEIEKVECPCCDGRGEIEY